MISNRVEVVDRHATLRSTGDFFRYFRIFFFFVCARHEKRVNRNELPRADANLDNNVCQRRMIIYCIVYENIKIVSLINDERRRERYTVYARCVLAAVCHRVSFGRSRAVRDMWRAVGLRVGRSWANARTCGALPRTLVRKRWLPPPPRQVRFRDVSHFPRKPKFSPHHSARPSRQPEQQ